MVRGLALQWRAALCPWRMPPATRSWPSGVAFANAGPTSNRPTLSLARAGVRGAAGGRVGGERGPLGVEGGCEGIEQHRRGRPAADLRRELRRREPPRDGFEARGEV